jgi:hypothetical protein
MSWESVLTEISDGSHIAQVYQDDGFLVDAVSLFIAEGLRKQEAVIIIAAQAHWDLFGRRLQANGHDWQAARSSGQLTILDAHETLALFMQEGLPDWKKFKAAISGVIEEIQVQDKHIKIRAYGEMVNILWRKGNLQGAIRLEELWNDFMKLYSFSLFCAYTMDGLDEDINSGPLQAVCKTHSHLIPARDYMKFECAVNEASQKILGSSLTNMLQTISKAEPDLPTKMPPAQTVLLWLKKNMPVTADKVLSYARHHLATLQNA